MSKTVLITGASKGIGRAEAVRFANGGYNILINYNSSKEKAEELVKELTKNGTNALALEADVADRKQVNLMVAEGIRQFGKIDVLINNAGIAQQKLFTDISELEWDRMFDVNIKGIFNCTQEILPGMIHRKSGKIINTSSIWGIAGASCEVHYSAAKAAVIGFSKALAKEVGPSGIQVNCVAPGVIETQMNAALTQEIKDALKEETPLCRIGTGADIANCVFFLASDESNFITGQVISPNGGIVI